MSGFAFDLNRINVHIVHVHIIHVCVLEKVHVQLYVFPKK